jgi:hypothetical protein
VLACVRSEQDVAVWLDTVEYSMRTIVRQLGRFDDHWRQINEVSTAPGEAIEELNERFRRAGFGYRLERGKIVRVDSEFMHQEVTLPALTLLSDSRFAGADQEFRNAHDHLKAGEFKDCAVDALNALESTMKAICDAKGWKYEKGGAGKRLN